MSIESNILQLKAALDYRKNNADIFHLFSNMGEIGIIETTFHPGKEILRGRINDIEHFKIFSELSYKPASLNKTFYRASTPNMTMFYGSFIPAVTNETEINVPYVTICFEISPFLGKPDEIGKIRVTFGTWEVIAPIKLVTVVFEDEFKNKTALFDELNSSFNEFIQNNTDSNLQENTVKFNHFLSSEFSKKISGNNHLDYLISGAYTEHIIKAGYDGIIYPSVQMEGKAFNVAIKPSAVDKSLKLKTVNETTFYKFNKEVIMDWDTICNLENDCTAFDFKDDSRHLGLRNCLETISNKIISNATTANTP